ncbi:MAG: hypothetical protein CMA65_05380 [Euryarchaeota archaeon]|nr:hypothetical protein [Euryarchaeota archaeon]
MRSWLVVVVLLSVAASPMLTQTSILDESDNNLRYSSPIQATISPTSGWISGGEEITITGSGFSQLAFSNTTYDGLNHQWTKTTADYGNEAGHENAIAVDSNGHVHIVHASGDGYAFTHSVYDGSSWTPTAIKNCEGSYCWDTHMVIDDNDELHAAYSSNTGLIVYMHYDGSSWASTQVASGAKVGPVGIALDSNNQPHISFTGYHQYCGNGLRLASFDGASWSTNIIESGGNKGCDSAIIIDGNNNAYIAFQDRDQSKLKFTTNKSGSWITYAPDTGGYNIAYPGYYSSLAMDDQGQFHIAHYDSDNDDLRYSTGVPNGAWSTDIVDSSGDTGRNPSIAVDAAGDPHIVYRSWNGWKFKYATLNPSSPNWQVSTIENHPGGSQGDGTGESNSLIIDDGGMMHVAYTDETNGLLRYATKSTGVSVTNEVTVKFGQLGSVTADVIDDSTIRLTTPAVANPGTSTISLIDVEGNEHQLSSTFEFIDQNDLDGDSIPNANDDCPELAGTSTQDLDGCPDDDGDGYSNSGDAFPNDVLEWADTDGDGVGNNADAFPNDSSETEDSDDDGVGDNSDAFPFNAFEQIDSDGDGVGDNSDAFPNNPSETVDSDGDGVGDNADAFPQNAYEQQDSDGDGVGDNTDAFPNDSSESLDNDGDGVGDLNDLCSNTIQDAEVDGNGCSLAQLDSDGDGYLDTQDTFPLDSTQWQDTDGDGYGDNWGDSDWNDTREPEWPGIFVNGAVQADYCPGTFGNSSADGFYGCIDNDGNGIPDQFQQPETNETDDGNETQTPLDTDGDGVPDIEDDCPATASSVVVDADGCEVEETQENSETSSAFESFFSGEADAVTTSVGFGAILLAFFALLQTNAVAAVLPDTFRWVQVLRKNSKLSKEERNELTYLQSLVQAYYNDPQEFAEELENLKADLTARFTNNQIKRETREKLLILIEELQSSSSSELYKIAHNDTYFGLSQVIDTNERTSLLEEKLAMSVDVDEQNLSENPPTNLLGDLDDKGTYWIEWPVSSGTWHYRYAPEESWTLWEN